MEGLAVKFLRPRAAMLAAALLGSLLLVSLLLAATASAVLVAVKPLKLHPKALKVATATEPYSHSLHATGGTAPYTFTVESGSPPEGVSLSGSGELSGTPTAFGSGTFTVLVTDSSSPAQTATMTYTLAVQLDVGPKSIPKTTAYSFLTRFLTAAGGTGPYDFALVSGELPTIIELFSEPGFDALSGTPYNAGTYTFTIEAKDKSSSATGTRAYTLKVALAMSPESGTQPYGTVGEPYFATANAYGGSGSYHYEISEGALPEGLTMGTEGTSATFSGTPTKAEAATFRFKATDEVSGLTSTAQYHLTVWATSFPRGRLRLEEKDHEGSFRGRDTLFLAIKREAKGTASGSIFDAEGSTGKWRYDTVTHDITVKWPEIGGTGGDLYKGSCEPVAGTCSGTNSFGTFTLAR